jgi:hypothetical protein
LHKGFKVSLLGPDNALGIANVAHIDRGTTEIAVMTDSGSTRNGMVLRRMGTSLDRNMGFFSTPVFDVDGSQRWKKPAWKLSRSAIVRERDFGEAMLSRFFFGEVSGQCKW